MKENNLDNQYIDLCRKILLTGSSKEGRNGNTISVFGEQIVHYMGNGFPILTTKKVPFKTVATELMWFMLGRTDLRWLLERNCNIWTGDAYKRYYDNSHEFRGDWPDDIESFKKRILDDVGFSNKWGDLGAIYGAQWRKTGKTMVDQLSLVIRQLKDNPDNRRMLVNAWNIEELPEMVLPPCHYSFQFYTHKLRDGRRAVSLLWNQRSVDVPLGLPFNIASYGLLLEIIAKEVDMVPYKLVGNLGDCHIYENQIEGIQEQINRFPKDLPTLKIKNNRNLRSALAFDGDNIYLSDYKLIGYDPHPTIKFPLSN